MRHARHNRWGRLPAQVGMEAMWHVAPRTAAEDRTFQSNEINALLIYIKSRSVADLVHIGAFDDQELKHSQAVRSRLDGALALPRITYPSIMLKLLE